MSLSRRPCLTLNHVLSTQEGEEEADEENDPDYDPKVTPPSSPQPSGSFILSGSSFFSSKPPTEHKSVMVTDVLHLQVFNSHLNDVNKLIKINY